MHIANDRYNQSLTALEQAHIETCESCRAEQQAVLMLNHSAQFVELINPPLQTWSDIEKRLPEKVAPTSTWKQLMYGAAATILFTSVGWLMWSQQNVQQQLEQVLLSNMLLEDKIHFQQQITFQQAAILHELRELDIQLMASKTTKEKIAILMERRRVMTEHLTKPKEENNEISI